MDRDAMDLKFPVLERSLQGCMQELKRFRVYFEVVGLSGTMPLEEEARVCQGPDPITILSVSEAEARRLRVVSASPLCQAPLKNLVLWPQKNSFEIIEPRPKACFH